MPSAYLTADDLADYGQAKATTTQVQAASGLLDSYLNRHEGLAWVADALGRPSYMAALDPSFSGTLASAVAPGTGVMIVYRGPAQVGDALVIGRDSGTQEVVAVAAVGQGTVTLARVLLAHAAGDTVEGGLLITEQMPLTPRRSVARVSRPQLQGVAAAAGRYGPGRRPDNAWEGAYGFMAAEAGLFQLSAQLGAVPLWEWVDPAGMDLSPQTGEVWFPTGFLLASYSDVRVSYVAGFRAGAVPAVIKQATASIMANLAEAKQQPASYKVMQAGGTRLERFNDSMIDADTKVLLTPYRARVMA